MTRRIDRCLTLALLGLALSAPVHAAPDFIDEPIVVAKREPGQDSRHDPRENRSDERRAHRREAEREAPPGYGYGYERRQQDRAERFDEDARPRGRR